MQRYCPVCNKTVPVKQVGHRYHRCRECGHNLKMSMRDKRDLVTGTFGKQR